MEKINLGIVVSEYNYDITMMMLERAKEHAEFLGADVKYVLKAPGTFDIPLLVRKLLEKKDVDAVVTLGAVIEGETEHDEIVMQNAARKIEDLSVEFGKPVTLGISGPGESRLQAEARIEKARDAVEAAIKLVKRLRDIS
ncbi:6,7-dimethyl-8-ribityllumazine synthase [Candidatus Aciduliprofundum boonei]|uniref:6,7-dimethyl-8-ribityllumazine synthase n=1 Tax=Aciduliprofundum boonei (strain DSM 19572 / T469) TaxID=439481 RepID=B5I9H6_ACIB4|nr:6,7-dimethyl-8-ribityllumazine synthase [Candidatus Aciduliprofundum boonei]ADD08554.1 6,7-dimethyl-8-ribityllumazine synthase [Aciduliprofundum boonei T469]EDY37082.1 6,7-dimethyl-8-ribityllumazine synthase [Aciduliprofundum boonei T469]HII55736.1 6,7-dimethyl-8-ribityllumazine synthase [Candidatus Aciduliprofundum boonei]